MKYRWIGLLLGLSLGQVDAASFDCTKAGTKVEKLICCDAPKHSVYLDKAMPRRVTIGVGFNGMEPYVPRAGPEYGFGFDLGLADGTATTLHTHDQPCPPAGNARSSRWA